MKKALILSLVFSAAVLLWRNIRPSLAENISWSRAVLDDRGELLRLTLSQDQKYRLKTELKDYPPGMVQAILFKEDKYFRSHFGINPYAIFRAAYQTFVKGGRRIGGSTVSMQLARLMYQIPTKTILGKIKQGGIALYLEMAYSKDEILEAYLNLLPYGSNVEGAGTASLIYFGKPVLRLNLPEIMTLAVMPQSPKLRSLGAHGEIENTTLLIQARNQLFQMWSSDHNLDANEKLSMNLPIRMKGTKDLPFEAPHFTEDILATNKIDLKLETSLHRKTQKIIESRIRNYVQRQAHWGIENAAALLLDWTTMEVKAEVGSVDFFNEDIGGQVNGVKAFRSPGSTLKPLAYAMGFDQGLVHGQSLLKDAPASYGGFDPENFDKDFQGPISVEQALIRSRNLPAVQLVSQLKNPTFYEFLSQVGIRNMKASDYYGLSTILGGMEVTMEDLVRLYAALANQGKLKALRRSKNQSWDAGQQILSPEASYLVLDILKKLPRPPNAGGSPWAQKNLDVYWKTGTSQAFRDAWTLGIFGPYVLAVWVGNFDGESNPALIGREMAAPLFFEIVEQLQTAEKLEPMLARADDLNLKKIEVCSLSGQIPGPNCPHKKWALFIPGKSPIASCEIHREIWINPKNGRRLCQANSPGATKQIFEFWPSDLLKLFRQAGVPRSLPPVWDSSCAVGELAHLSQGMSPKITSPKADVIYSLRATESEHSKISLNAVTDSDVQMIYWFVDQSLVGKGKPDQTLLWPAIPGRHKIRAVDDQGRSDLRELQVQVVN